jgi:ATP-dependent metalloprotease FtsH
MQPINNKKKKIVLILLTLIVVILLFIVIRASSSVLLVSAKDFNKAIENSTVKEIYLKDKYIYAITDKKSLKSYASGVNLKEIYNKYPVSVYTKSSNYLIYIALFLLLSILITIIAILKRDRIAELTTLEQSSNKNLSNDNLRDEIEPISSDISFDSIAGISDVKEDLKEIVEFLKNPAKYSMLDIKMPKGLLLVGPPGVGKTLIAKAISSEANVPFFYHSGANFVQIYAGMGAKRVKELFNKAKEVAPSIIFIDEIDAVGKSRDKLNSDEREATLNQLLVEMDGFEENLGVVVVAATNRIDVLDSALLRAGRFDRRVFIDLPNLKEREQIVAHYLKNKPYSFDIKEVAKATAGFSPASLETLINEAWLYAYKQKRNKIEIDDIYRVKDRVIYGKKRVLSLSQKERELQALYSATKAVVASWLGFGFDKVSLLSNLSIQSDLAIVSKEYLLNRVKVLIAGTIYLKNSKDDIYSISKEDNKKALEIIDEIVQNYSLPTKSAKFDIEIIQKDVEVLLARLNSAILDIAKELEQKESISYIEVKKRIDALF